MRRLARLPIYLVLAIVILAYATPFAVILTTSLKTYSQTETRFFSWIPDPVTLDEYRYTLSQFPFARWVLNSVIVTTGTVALILLVSLPAGYAFARLKFKGKNLLFGLMLLSIMIPLAAYVPQLYLEMSYLKMINTYLALMIPLATSGISIFLFRQFISQLPVELEDAARIDGCNDFQVFTRVILPLTKPAVISVVIFSSVKSWNSLMWPLLAGTVDTVKTVPVGLAVNIFTATNASANPTNYGVVMAASVLSIVVPVTLFLFLQRYFVQGIATTGLK